jgi:hypothetical protein
MDWVRQALNVVFALAMPVTTFFTFSRGATVQHSILAGPKDPPIVPAGYAFSIWGLIYTASVAYAIYQALPAQRESHLLRRIGFYTAAGFFLTALWLVLARFELLWFTVACIYCILAAQGAAFLRIADNPAPKTPAGRWLVEMPISIFAGWVTVAVFANIAAALQYEGWSSWGPGEVGWSIILLVLAGALAAVFTVQSRGNVWYALTVVWALVAIVVANLTKQRIPSVALIAGALVLVTVAVMFWAWKFKGRMKTTPEMSETR